MQNTDKCKLLCINQAIWIHGLALDLFNQMNDKYLESLGLFSAMLTDSLEPPTKN